MSRYRDGDDAAGGTPRQHRRRPHRPHQRGSRLAQASGWLSSFLVLATIAVTLAAYLSYRSVWNSIHRVDVTDLGRQPPKYGSALNILLIGSDSRAGPNKRFGAGISGQRSDTVLLLHISPGRQRVTVLSIPRDSMVPYLSCASAGPGTPAQAARPGQYERINATFADGGPGCLWKTVEQETGIHIDHFIELAFTGFEHVINDVGGVSVCLPAAIYDPDSGLRMSAGLHHVMGAQALAFWRERHIGAGSDTQRIQRDQYLMASIAQGVEHSGILSSPARSYSVISDAARAMTTDTGLDQETMLTIAESLRRLSSGSVQFVTVPEIPYPQDRKAEIEFAQPQAGALFQAIAHDAALPRPARAARQRGRRQATSARPPRSAPASSSVTGLARTYGGITGSARACGDQAAFAGGDKPGDFVNR